MIMEVVQLPLIYLHGTFGKAPDNGEFLAVSSDSLAIVAPNGHGYFDVKTIIREGMDIGMIVYGAKTIDDLLDSIPVITELIDKGENPLKVISTD